MSESSRQDRESFSRRSFAGRLMAGAAGLTHSASRPRAAEASALTEGYESLFDGQTLEGWHTNPGKIGHGTGGHWQVEQGMITGEQDPPGSGNGGLLLTDRKFGDFDLWVDVNPDWGPCSGIFFRCTDAGEGFQVYVDYHDGGNVGHLRGEMKGAFALMPFKIFGQLDESGQLRALETRPDARTKQWPPNVYRSICTASDWLQAWNVGEWNSVRIQCVGKYPTVRTWINGLAVCHFDGASCTLPGYDKDHVWGRLGGRGSIGLQVHGGKGWPAGSKCRWKNIRIKEL